MMCGRVGGTVREEVSVFSEEEERSRKKDPGVFLLDRRGRKEETEDTGIRKVCFFRGKGRG